MAYAELLTMLASTARTYVRRRLGDHPGVEDVVQETLLSVHQARRTYDSGRPFAPWFFAILSNRLADARRRQLRISRREVAGAVPDTAMPDRRGSDVMGVDLAAVNAAIETLPTRQRAIVRALKLQDESVRDVADRLGMSASAVKVAAHRAYRTLRGLLGERRR